MIQYSFMLGEKKNLFLSLYRKLFPNVGLLLISFPIQAFLILAGRTQFWRRTPELSDSIAALLKLTSVDFLVLFVVMLLINRWVHHFLFYIVSNILLGLLFFLPIFFHLKTEMPLSLGLLAQIGGIFELKTSIADASQARNIMVFVALIGLTNFLCIFGYFFKQRALVAISGKTLTVVFLLIAFIFPWKKSNLEKELSHNFFLSLFISVDSFKKIKSSAILAPIAATPIEMVSAMSGQASGKNIILLILESFDTSIVLDEELFSQVMPNLWRRSKQAISFTDHYAPWPFSSKSLYSITCGLYPIPSKVIDLRIKANENCQSWPTALERGGYKLWLGYSGDLKYDRMGEFFRAQANFDLHDQHTLKRFNTGSWELGLDDLSLLLGFEEFLANKVSADPFAAVFIPINSHHPYWTPPEFANKFKDPYLNSFFYQDFLIEKLFELLDKKDVLDQTVVFITSDHGKREFTQYLPGVVTRGLYQVPLFVFDGENKRPRQISYPTSHVDLRGSLISLAGVQGGWISEALLENPKEVLLIYDLEHTSFLLRDRMGVNTLVNLDQNTVIQSNDWIIDINQSCPDKDKCHAALSQLKSLLNMEMGE